MKKPAGLLALAMIFLIGIVQAQPEARDVSLIRLIADPEAFHGQRVRVVGFIALKFEDRAVYFNEESATHSISENALWLTLDPSITDDQQESASGRYAIVEGRVDVRQKGHMGAYTATLKDVSRLEPVR